MRHWLVWQRSLSFGSQCSCSCCFFLLSVVGTNIPSPTLSPQPSPTQGEVIPVLLRRRSLIALSGESRYTWQHGIENARVHKFGGRRIYRDRRVSLTFRHATGGDGSGASGGDSGGDGASSSDSFLDGH